MKHFVKIILAVFIVGAVISTLTACEKSGKEKTVTYESFHEDLCEDAKIEADKIIFYFLGDSPDEIVFVLYGDAYEDQYKLVFYKANEALVSSISTALQLDDNQAYPFSQEELETFSEIIDEYDPVEITGPEFNKEWYLPIFEAIVVSCELPVSSSSMDAIIPIANEESEIQFDKILLLYTSAVSTKREFHIIGYVAKNDNENSENSKYIELEYEISEEDYNSFFEYTEKSIAYYPFYPSPKKYLDITKIFLEKYDPFAVKDASLSPSGYAKLDEIVEKNCK